MKAGQTDIEVGCRIMITNVAGEDAFLNGMTGVATHPFAFGRTDKGWIGVYLNDHSSPYKEKCNIKASECVELVVLRATQIRTVFILCEKGKEPNGSNEAIAVALNNPDTGHDIELCEWNRDVKISECDIDLANTMGYNEKIY